MSNQIACCSCCGSPLTVRLRQTTTRSLKMHLPPCKTDPSEGTLRKAHHFGTSHGLALKMFSVRDEFSNSCEHCVAVHSRNLRHFGSSSAIQRDANAQSAALPPIDPSDQRKSSMGLNLQCFIWPHEKAVAYIYFLLLHWWGKAFMVDVDSYPLTIHAVPSNKHKLLIL